MSCLQTVSLYCLLCIVTSFEQIKMMMMMMMMMIMISFSLCSAQHTPRSWSEVSEEMPCTRASELKSLARFVTSEQPRPKSS